MTLDNETITLLTPLILAVVGLILQYLKSRDTNKHGDALLVMLKQGQDTMEKIAGVIPAIKPYVDQYDAIVLEADKIWNSGGMTADDIRFIQMQYNQIKLQIDAVIAKYRTLKEPTQ